MDELDDYRYTMEMKRDKERLDWLTSIKWIGCYGVIGDRYVEFDPLTREEIDEKMKED